MGRNRFRYSFHKLGKAFQNAPGEFSEISRELQSFHFVVADLKEQAEDPNSSFNRHATSKKAELVAMTQNLVATMKELEVLYTRYQRMGRRDWLRFRLGTEDLSAMRSKLTVQISAVNAFINGLNMASISRLEPMLETIFQLLNRQIHGSMEMAEKIVNTQSGKDLIAASWARLEMGLRVEGVPL